MNFDSLKKSIAMWKTSLAACAMAVMALTSCNDETSKIGSSLTEGEVNIYTDSLTFDLKAKAIVADNYDSRTGNLLLGNLNVPEYGALNCSFVTRLMCATKLILSDSVKVIDPERVDSCKLVLLMTRGELTGDSLTPQRVRVYNLEKQLPDDITNNFNPEGYFDSSKPLGSASYTASLAGKPDSVFVSGSNNTVPIYIKLPKEFGKKIFSLYKDNPETFSWPQNFAKVFPGFYIDTYFGKGCVSNIDLIGCYIYYNFDARVSTTTDGVTTVKTEKRSAYAIPFTSSPEVLSSNNISFKVSDYLKDMIAEGDMVITTPGGYNTRFTFPAREILDRYLNTEHNLSLISSLTLSIPAETIDNEFGIGATPTLMLIKTADIEDFFNNNKIPDNKTSFTATYDSYNKRYLFTSMRQYIVQLLKKGSISDEDVDFTLIPVNLTTETVSNGYGSSTYTTKCTPYTIKPTMSLLHTKDAMVIFTFSSQLLD